MKSTSALFTVAAVIAVCCMALPARAGDWQAYVVYAHVDPDYDWIYCYDSSGGVVWSNHDQVAANGAVGALDLWHDQLYTTQWDGKRWQRWDRSGVRTIDQGQWDNARGTDVGVGPDGILYVAVRTSTEQPLGVQRYNPITGSFIHTFVESSVAINGLAFDPATNVYAVMPTKVVKYDAATKAVLSDPFISGGSAFTKAKWHNGELYVAEMNAGGGEPNGAILRYNSSGVLQGAFVAAGAGGLQNPKGFDFTPDGGMLVCDYYSNPNDMAVRRYDNTGSSLGVFAVPPPSVYYDMAIPNDVVVENVASPRDHIKYFAFAAGASPHDMVQAYDSGTNLLWSSTDGVGAAGESYQDLVLGPDDMLYVSSWDGKCIHRYERETGAYVDRKPISGSFQPRGITAGPDDKIYVVARLSGVHRHNPAAGGAFETVFINDTEANLFDVAFGPDGNFYTCTDTTVKQYDGSGALLDGSFVTGGNAFRRLTWHEGDLYVSANDTGGEPNGRILRFSSSGASLGELVPTGLGGLENPVGVGFTPDGYHLLVCDYYPSSIVRRYSAQTGAYIDNHINLGLGEYVQGVVLWQYPVSSSTVVVVR